MTLSITIVVSAIVSLTLTPMMCALLLRHVPEAANRLYRLSEHAFATVIEWYGRTLNWVLERQAATLLVALGTLLLTVFLYLMVPKGFFPVQDTGVVIGGTEAPQDISFAAMSERQQALADVILKDPAVQSLSSFVGIDGTNATLNSGRIQVNLKPLDERKIGASDWIRRVQTDVARVEGSSSSCSRCRT